VQIYRVVGTVVYAAMSADASCRGLRSPRDGPLVMEFTRGEHTREQTSRADMLARRVGPSSRLLCVDIDIVV